MSIDIQRVVWRIITYSGHGRKYPVVSGLLILVFFLYICFPLVFYYLICCFPILVSTFVSVRFYFKTKYPEFQNSDQQRSYVDVNRSSTPSIRNLKSVRRNARMEVPEWDRKAFEEMTNFSPRCSLFSNNTNALDENDGRGPHGGGQVEAYNGGGAAAQVEAYNDGGGAAAQVEAYNDGGGVGAQVEAYNGGGGVAAQVEAYNGGGGVGAQVEAYNGGGGGVGAQVEAYNGGGGVAAQVDGKRETEDGQNNVMVLGTLESERRNQRLESLMAKRRARKLLKIAVDQSLMKLDAILPSNLPPIVTSVSNNPYEEILRMPGSAPSIMENPFDLPYDPHEEKPDLMADSFQQEFMTPTNHKEFCRHESFRRATLLTRLPNNAQFNNYYSSQTTLVTESRFKLQSREPSVDGIELEGEKMETDLVNNQDMDETEIGNDQMRKAFNLLASDLHRHASTSSIASDLHGHASTSSKASDLHGHASTSSIASDLHRHASTSSIASDLQVEVSEVGSPPLTTDGDSVSCDIEGEPNAQKLRELDDIIQVDFSGSNARDINPRLLIQQICDNSFSSPRSVLPQNNLEDVQLPENSIHHLSSNTNLDTSEGSCNTTDYKTAADRMNKLALQDTQGKPDSSIQSTEGEPKTFITSKELSKAFNESNTDFTEKLTGIDPSESQEKNAKSGAPETMVVKQKEPISSNKDVQEGNVVVNINDSVVNMKDERDVPVLEQSNATGI